MCMSVERDIGATRPGSGLGQKWFILPSYGRMAGGSACGTPLLTPNPRATPVLNHFPSAGLGNNAASSPPPAAVSSSVSAEYRAQAGLPGCLPGQAFGQGAFQSNPDRMTGTYQVFQESPLFGMRVGNLRNILLSRKKVLIYLVVFSQKCKNRWTAPASCG